MFKLILLVAGLATGAAGAASWLLSTPDTPAGGGRGAPLSLALGDRAELVKARVNEAVAEGQRAGAETENRLQHQFETFRRHPDRPAVS